MESSEEWLKAYALSNLCHHYFTTVIVTVIIIVIVTSLPISLSSTTITIISHHHHHHCHYHHYNHYHHTTGCQSCPGRGETQRLLRGLERSFDCRAVSGHVTPNPVYDTLQEAGG